MKITKYAQSCLLVEASGRRLLFDPGALEFKDSLLEKDWINIDVVLITHKHKDHCHEEAISKILDSGAVLYTSGEVSKEYPNLKAEIIKEGDKFSIGDIKVEVVKAVHGFIPRLKEMNIEIEENIGFILNDDKTTLYNTSDCIGFPNDYKCDVLALPVNNHGVCFDPFSAAEFAVRAEAKTVIPLHYDNPALPADIDEVEREFIEHKLNYKILEVGESLNI